jgi:ribokinase
MRAAVVGHVEWVTFARVPDVPLAGDIVHASETWELPGGGGAGAAVQLAKLGGDCLFITALGDDEIGRRAAEGLRDLGVTVAVAWRDGPTRRAFTHVDATGERTITVLGDRMAPLANDQLPWNELDGVDALYFTAGDAGALRAAREAAVLVATTRTGDALKAGVQLDALVGSSLDPSETYRRGDIEPEPALVVRTEGAAGGSYETPIGEARRFEAPPLPSDVVDRYGAGDSFAAGLAFALARGDGTERAVEFAARCGAAALTGRGPYEGQLAAGDL